MSFGLWCLHSPRQMIIYYQDPINSAFIGFFFHSLRVTQA